MKFKPAKSTFKLDVGVREGEWIEDRKWVGS